MSKKYEKVTEIQVLKKYYEILNEYGIDYLPARIIARELKTSKYQVYKAFEKLKELGYVKINKYPVHCEEYYNGLYTETIPILSCNIFDITTKGWEIAREMCNGKSENR